MTEIVLQVGRALILNRLLLALSSHPATAFIQLLLWQIPVYLDSAFHFPHPLAPGLCRMQTKGAFGR